MTRGETLRILAVLRAAYPSAYRGLTPEDAQAAVGLWETMFRAEDYALVDKAVRAVIATSKWPPTVAEVRERLAVFQTARDLDAPPPPEEAWARVWRAVQHSGYPENARTEFEALPLALRRTVGSASVLHQWALTPPREVQTVIASHFRRSYQARLDHAQAVRQLPPDLQREALPYGERSFDMTEIRQLMAADSGQTEGGDMG